MFAPKLNPNDKLDVPPVLIVGGGPTGLSAAMSLSRAHVPVRLIDKARESSPYSRAIGIQARTLELFEQHRFVEPFSNSAIARGWRISIRTVSASRDSTSTRFRRVIPICCFSINSRPSCCSLRISWSAACRWSAVSN